MARGAQQEPQGEFSNTTTAYLFLTGLCKQLGSLFFEGKKMEKEGKQRKERKELGKEVGGREGRTEEGKEGEKKKLSRPHQV